MKNLVIGLLISAFFLTACGGTSPAAQITPDAAVVQTTSTPSPLPTATQTLVPSATPTASVTPLPTIPTFTPTFDVSTIVTVTPAPQAECPMENPEKASSLEFEVFPSGRKYVGHPTIDIILNFLNSGGSIEDLKSGLVKVSADFVFQDITNDGVPDFTLISGSAFQIINILYCDKGRYRLFPKDDIESESLGSENIQFEIQDLDRNGTPEIVSIGSGRIGLEINIFE